MKFLKDRGIPFSLHSDFAMAPAEPLTLVWTAVNRVTDKGRPVSQDQRIDLFTAMQGITINAARTLNLENKIGSIKAGKTANFTLLNENPFKVKKMHIKDIEVAGVVFRGDLKIREPKLVGGDKDTHGCIGSAGYKWCAKIQNCERPWELAKDKSFKNSAEAFNSFCQNK
ncbi:amidohydrolase family protein [Sulfurimonas paralvinellae]|uniref:amidohydrolase family protein n=1 Tax=Sulfurimonas paralvinellae TaxID=317658 RepID=UPI0021F808DC|nr:amidohydrolase family protein [Sulfurimonas paralvinellae]